MLESSMRRVVVGQLVTWAALVGAAITSCGGGDTRAQAAEDTETPDRDNDERRDEDPTPSKDPPEDDERPDPEEPDASEPEERDAGPPPPVTERYDAGPEQSPPPEVTPLCEGNRAFAASYSAFVPPTPPDLAIALNAQLYGKNPVSVVLTRDDEGPLLAATYTTQEDGVHSFPGGLDPDLARAKNTPTGFESQAAQLEAWLWLDLEDGPVELPLENVTLLATALNSCTAALITLTGVVSEDYADLVAEISGDQSEPEVDGGDDRGDMEGTSTSVKLLIEAELVDFDYESLQ